MSNLVNNIEKLNISPTNLTITEIKNMEIVELKKELDDRGLSSDWSNKNTLVGKLIMSCKIINNVSLDKVSLDKLSVKIPRKYIQGGLSNEQYEEDNLYDWRLQHHLTTDYFKRWKNYETCGVDSKNTDCRSKEDQNKKAEGKCINKKKGVNFNPSSNTGVGRKFNDDDLKRCFEINSDYYLYDRGVITNNTIEFIIYMVPIEIIKEWYKNYGNKKGIISYNNIKSCLYTCTFNETHMDVI